MWASSPDSDSPLLRGLILASAVFAAAAIVVWFVTFLVRAQRLRRRSIELAAEEEMTRLVLDQLAGYSPTSALPTLPRWKRRLLLHVLREMILQTKGKDHATLVDFAARAGFRAGALEDVRHRNAAARQEACQVLSFFDDDVSLQALRRALGDRDAAVRVAAARALLRKDRIDSLTDLLAQLRFPTEDPPLLLAELFARLPERLRGEAVAMLGEPMPPEWLRMLAIALARNQISAAFEPIAALRQSPSPRLRAAVWVAFRALGDPRAGELVREGLDDDVPDVRRAALDCAAVVCGAESVSVIAERLDDADWWVRYHAAAALWDLGSEGRAALQQHNVATIHETGRQLVAEREEAARHA